MGDRYLIEVKHCGATWDAPYAPTSGYFDTACPKCGEVIDLEKYSGISAESTASNEGGLATIREHKKLTREEGGEPA